MWTLRTLARVIASEAWQSHIAATAAIHLFFLLKEIFRCRENIDCSPRRNDGLGFPFPAGAFFFIIRYIGQDTVTGRFTHYAFPRKTFY